MTFYEIALKNARKKFRSYLVYFCGIAFSVVIFNLFCAMYYNPTFEAYRFGAGKMTALFKGAAIAVFGFVAVFVMYSGNYFAKAQKKEIAIYSLLGMRKTQIATLMFLETFFIGALAVALGIVLGMGTAGYFTGLLMRFMAIGTAITLSVELRAIFATVLAFAILFGINGFRAYQTIYRYTLIELLSATKRNEGAPDYSPIGASSSIVLLIIGYVVAGTMNLNVGGFALMRPVFLVVACVALGTYLLFRNFVPMAVAFLKKRRTLYYQTSNFISISQIAFRLKANSRMLAVVSLLCAVTVTMISASYSLYRGLEDGTDFYAPFSYLAKGITNEQHDQILRTVDQMGEIRVTADDRIELVRVAVRNDAYAIQKGEGEGERQGERVNAYLLSESMYEQIIIDIPGNISYIGMYKANFALYGSYVFIGLFIGILFLLAVGSVMYYKLITEAQEEAPRYEILRKTGMKKKEALSSVAKQLGMVYAVPFAVGLVHTAFALGTYNRMMDLIGQETPTLQNAALVVLLFLIVYGLFYALSVNSYHGIVWKEAGQNGRNHRMRR